jgi:hypothetical protein
MEHLQRSLRRQQICYLVAQLGDLDTPSHLQEISKCQQCCPRAVLPFADTNIPLLPQFNLEAVLGRRVPVFDIADYYAPNESHNFLVNLPHLGAALADTFSTPEHNVTKRNILPDYPVVL